MALIAGFAMDPPPTLEAYGGRQIRAFYRSTENIGYGEGYEVGFAAGYAEGLAARVAGCAGGFVDACGNFVP